MFDSIENDHLFGRELLGEENQFPREFLGKGEPMARVAGEVTIVTL